MCLAVYLATDEPVQQIKWNDKSPAFHVKQEGKWKAMHSRIKKKHLYYVGSNQGCGCGFLLDGIDKDSEEWKDIKKNYEAFGKYLTENVSNEAAKIFVCWEGDQKKEPTQFRDVRVEEIQNGFIVFEELAQYTIKMKNHH
jgi:hypothetical protein